MKKILTTAAASAAFALMLTGCASTSPAAGENTAEASGFGECDVQSQASGLELETVTDGTLTIATVLPNPGWWNGNSPESTDSGFEYCMGAEMAAMAGLKSITLKNLAWDQYISGTATGYDVAIAGTTITDERKEIFDFSTPYFSSNLGIATKDGADVTADNIREQRIGVLQGNMGAAFVTDELKPATAPSLFQSQNDMFTALQAGQIDAVITDTTLALTSTHASNGLLVVIGQYLTEDGYGVATPKGAANSAPANTAVEAMIADGTLDRLSETYLTPQFGQDPNSITAWKLG